MNGTAIWLELAKASPGLLVALVLVYLFLKDRKETLRAIERMQDKGDQRAVECHDVQRQTNAVVERNTQAFIDFQAVARNCQPRR